MPRSGGETRMSNGALTRMSFGSKGSPSAARCAIADTLCVRVFCFLKSYTLSCSPSPGASAGSGSTLTGNSTPANRRVIRPSHPRRRSRQATARWTCRMKNKKLCTRLQIFIRRSTSTIGQDHGQVKIKVGRPAQVCKDCLHCIYFLISRDQRLQYTVSYACRVIDLPSLPNQFQSVMARRMSWFFQHVGPVFPNSVFSSMTPSAPMVRFGLWICKDCHDDYETTEASEEYVANQKVPSALLSWSMSSFIDRGAPPNY